MTAGQARKVANISIVDDDESVRVAMESLIGSLGYNVYTFSSAKEYLQSPRVNDTSCLISDVQMPNMTGVELQGALIAQGYRTPIIFVTGFPDKGIQEQAMTAGAVCFLKKPLDAQTLSKYLDKALQQQFDN
jgi:FixJ family two-component response regulator